nr:MAG TPA: hypothetical protein [Caudoviricetes sp.]
MPPWHGWTRPAGPSMRRWRRPWRGRFAVSGRRSPYAYR